MDVFRKLLIVVACLMGATTVLAQEHWTCDISRYEYDMTVFFHLYDNDQRVSGDDYEVAAFCGEECRGVAKVQSVAFLGKEERYYYLRVRSNIASGEEIHFKVYKKSANMEVDAQESFTFHAQEAVGRPSSPFIIHIGDDADREAYVVLSPDSTTLTFYYDGKKTSHEGTTYDLNTGNTFPDWNPAASLIQHVEFTPSFAAARPVSTSGWFYKMGSITEIGGLQYLNTSEVTTMYAMFTRCSQLTTLNLNYFDTSNVTNMAFMFSVCEQLTSLDLSHFDTSNVTNMSYMFQSCTSLSTLDLSHFNTSNVTNMSWMFYYCYNLTSLNLSDFDTSKVKNMSWMFGACQQLTSLDVSHFDTSSVTDMSAMFYYCNYLPSLDVSHFDTSNVNKMGSMFRGCKKLSSLDVSHFNTSKAESMLGMFSGCQQLTSLDLNHFDTSKVKDVADMFGGCTRLSTLDLSNFIFNENVRTTNLLYNCSSLKYLIISSTSSSIDENCCKGVGTASSPCTIIAPDGFNFGVDTSGDFFQWKNGYFKLVKGEAYVILSPDSTTLTFYYDDMKATREGTAYGLNTGYSYPGWRNAASSILHVVFTPSFSLAQPVSTASWFSLMESITEIEGLQYLNTSEVTNMYCMFYHCYNLQSLDLSHFNTAKATDIHMMFDSCKSLTSLDLSSFDTGNVTNTSQMFYYCTNLTSLDISHFNTSNVTDMMNMFSRCSNLTTIDLSSFDTRKVTTMSQMFQYCTSLTDIDVSNFDTSNVIYMSFMFCGCESLTSLDLSHFNTSNVTSMLGMFEECYNLTSIDLSHFDTSNVTRMDRMFGSCIKLTSIDVSHFDTSKVTRMEGMFSICQSLSSLDVSNFDTSNVTHIYSMFRYCINLSSLDLGNFTFNTGMDTQYLLYNCTSLKTLTIPSTSTLINDNACNRVGTASSPCTIIAPEGFDFGVDTSGKYFIWKSGYFNLGSAFLLGDVNHDGAVNITDVMSVVNYILGQMPVVFFIENADMNGDGSINITDVMLIVDAILHGNAAMVTEHMREQLMDHLAVKPDANGYVICLDNHEPYTALQMDVVLPEGMELTAIKLENSRSDNHKAFRERVAGNHYRVVVYSQEGSEIKGSEGELLQLVTQGKRHGGMAVKDVMLTNAQLVTVVIPEASIVTGIGSPAIEDDDSPSFTIQGIPAEKHKRGVVVKKGSKYAVK